jgi:hypothetical protein
MRIKSLLPFDRYTLVTGLKVAEVMRRMEENVAPKRLTSNLVVTRWGQNDTHADKPYAGIIREQNFEISRVITYKNSFLPVIKGEVTHFLGQTEIKVTSRPHISVLVFCTFWMSVVFLLCLVLTFGIIKNGFEINKGFDPACLIPYAMLVFGGLLFVGPYKIEANKTRKFLADLLEGEEVNEAGGRH